MAPRPGRGDTPGRAAPPPDVEAGRLILEDHLDDRQVELVLINLLANAVRYTPDGGPIAVHWWQDDQGAHFSVHDAGTGIEAQHIPRLTERFYRVDAGRKASDGGTGLGLAIVKHCLEHHEGELDIDSTPGEGSTFTCHFPLQRRLLQRAA